MSRWVFKLFLAAIVLTTSAAAHAQQQAQQQPQGNQRRDVGTLKITVVDETGAAIVDSPVRIWSEKGVDRTVQTSQRGEAIFENLAPGKYAIHVESIGFDAQDFEQNVRRGNTNKQVTLAIASFVEQVDVTRDDTERALNDAFSSQLTQEQIDQLPDDAEEMAEVLEQMAGPGAMIRVNGFSGGRLPPKSQIAEIRFRFDPFSAEYHEGGFPRVDIRTKPGNGEWRNSMTLTFRDDALNARNAMALERGAEASQRAMWTIDGPIVKGKTSFSLAVGGLNSYDTETITSLRPGRTGLNTVEQPNDRLNIEARAEHALSKNHMLRVELQQNGSKQQNMGVGGYTELERAFTQERNETTFRISESGSIKGRYRNELRFEFVDEDLQYSSATDGIAINVLDQFNIGGAQRAGGVRTREFEIADNFDFTLGKKHSLRTGIEMEHSRLSADELTNNIGTFTFSNLDDFLAGTPRQFRRREGNPLVEYSNTEFAWYINDDIRLRKNVMMSVGLRYEAQSLLGDKNNFAPRAHVTWAPFKSAKTTLRAGAGIFYDWYDTGLYEDTLRVNGVNQSDLIIDSPCYPNWFECGNQQAQSDPSVIQASAFLVMPQVTRFSVGVEHQVTSWMGIRGNVFRQHGTNQFRSLNINAPVDGVRPIAGFDNISQIESIGESKTLGFEISGNFNYQPRRMFSFFHYRYGRSENDGTESSLPFDSNNLAAEWGPASNDIRHNVMWGVNAPIAFGFRTNFNVRYTSAPPYTITEGIDLNDDGVFYNDRPAGVGRNTARGDDALTMDLRLSWSKGFGAPRTPVGPGGGPIMRGGPPGGGGGGGGRRGGSGGGGGGGGPMMMMGGPGEQRRFTLEIFTQVNNLTNAVNFGGYSGVLTSRNFGLPSSAQAPRRIELGTRLGF
jgi:hypothetical protein